MAIRSDKRISILAVDDDGTCLSILEAILKKFHYQVLTLKNPLEALSILRFSDADAFDLVLADVHMPEMSGIELQQAIAREFNNLPVVLMSGHEKESIMQQGLESGAKFFLTKPISSDHLANLWRHVRGHDELDSYFPRFSPQNTPSNKYGLRGVFVDSGLFPNGASSDHGEDTERNSPSRVGSEERIGECSQTATTRKKKLFWKSALHNKFLEAIQRIGLERATPKRVLESMNEPRLATKHVASHLQKYRIFLQKVSEGPPRITTQRLSGRNRLKWLTSNNFPPIFIPSSKPSSPRESCPPQHVPGSSSALVLGQEASSSSLIAQSGLGNNGISLVHDTSASAGLLPRNCQTNSDPPLLNHRNAAISFPISTEIQSTSDSTVPVHNGSAVNIDQLPGISTISSSYPGSDAHFGGGGELWSVVNECQTFTRSNAVNIDQLAGTSTVSSSYPGSDAYLGGELWNVVNGCQTLPQSNAPEMGNVDNGCVIERSPGGSILLDLPELVRRLVDGDGANPTSQDQHQNVGTSATAFGSHGSTSGRDIHVLSSNEAPDGASDVVNYDQMGNVENGGERQCSPGSPVIDWQELARHFEGGDGVNPTSQYQNQVQNVGTSATTLGYLNTSGQDIHVPSFNQAPDEASDNVNYNEIENVDNGGERQRSPGSPVIDWQELERQLEDGDGVNPTSQDQSQVQNIGASATTFGSLSDMSSWDIHVPSFNQALDEACDNVNYNEMEYVDNGGERQRSPGSPVIDWQELGRQLENGDGVNPTSQDQNQVQNVGTSEYQTLLHSNAQEMGNVENGGEMQHSPCSPVRFDLQELVTRIVDGHGINPTYQDQHQVQNVGTNATPFGSLGNMSGRDIHVPSSNQAPDEDVNDDELWASILASEPLGEDYTF